MIKDYGKFIFLQYILHWPSPRPLNSHVHFCYMHVPCQHQCYPMLWWGCAWGSSIFCEKRIHVANLVILSMEEILRPICQSRHFDQFSHRPQWISIAFSHHKGHFASVQKWPILEHDHGDILEYCGGCFRATDLLIGQILSYIPSYQLSIIKITIFNT